MALLAFIAACGIGAVSGLLARSSGQLVRLAGLACLAAAFIAALLVGPGTRVTVGEVTLAGSEYSGLFLACVAGSGLLLSAVALVSGLSGELVPAALASLAGFAVAITAADPGVALIAGAAGATAGALVISRAAGSSGTVARGPEDDGRLAEIRTISIVAAGLGVAAIAILRPAWNGPSDGLVFGLAFLGLGGALAIRSGAVPFHVPAARLHRTGIPVSAALLLVWIPAGLGILAVGWSATTFGLRSDWLTAAVLVVQVVAVATLVLGSLAALVHDELEEVAVYSIVADAGFVLLAMAARTDAAGEPARLWLLVFVAAKTGLVAWTAALSRAVGTSSLDRLRGWLRRTPLLGLALAVIAVATLGWPGSPVFEARSTLIRLALPGWLQFLFAGSVALSLACYGRLLIVGLRSPTEDVLLARSELPRWQAASLPSVGPPAATAPADVAPAAAATLASRPTGHRSLAGIWRLNRTLVVSLVVVLGAGVSVALASGGMGASNAARFGIPLDTAAHSTPTRMPTPTPLPTTPPTPQPTLAPRPSAASSGSAAPSEAASPSASPAPGKTSAPARDNTK